MQPRFITIATQGSQSLALGLTTPAPMNRGSVSDYANDETSGDRLKGRRSAAPADFTDPLPKARKASPWI